MRCLVTGACGFIGSHMVEVLTAAGHDVVAADLPTALDADPEDRTRWPEICRRAGAELVALDVTDADSVVRATRRAQLVFHIAAVFDYTAPEHVLQAVNVDGTRNLFEALVRHGSCARVVNWGAGGIFGLPGRDGAAFDENSPVRPGNAYLVSKWQQEHVANQYRARGLEVTTVTPISPYGPRAAYGSGQLLMGLAGRPVVPRNLIGNVPLGHVRDLCAAALHLALHPAADGERYIVTDDGTVDAIDIARIVAEEVGRPLRLLPPVPLGAMRAALLLVAKLASARSRRTGKRALPDPDQVRYFGRDWRYSNAKLKATGFEMRWPDPEPGIRETVRWYLERGWIGRSSSGRG